MSFPFPRAYPGPMFFSGSSSSALSLIGNEWEGFALDFVSNTFARRTATTAEKLLASGPESTDQGLALDFTVNQSALGI